MTRRPQLTPEAIRRLTTATDPWLSCDDCFDQLDVVVEDVIARGLEMSRPLAVHLCGCAVCSEEAHSLATLVAPEHGLDQAAAVRAVDAAMGAGA
jgi:chemotaxis methyl-accepting protein methylase